MKPCLLFVSSAMRPSSTCSVVTCGDDSNQCRKHCRDHLQLRLQDASPLVRPCSWPPAVQSSQA
jgi:hypothetical protein